MPKEDAIEVEADHVALLDPAMRGRNSMNDFFVDRDAHGRWKSSIALERGLRPSRGDERLDIFVDLQRRQARLHRAAQVLDDVGEHVAGRAHETDLAGGLQLDHVRAPAAAPRTEARIVSIGPSPGTEASMPRRRYQSRSGAVCRAYTPSRLRTVPSVSSSRW